MPGRYLRCIVNILLYLAGVVLVFVLTPKLLVFFMPFVVGWLIALLANPLVRFMERRLKMVRKHSSMLIIITAIALVVIGGYFAITAIVRELYGFWAILPTIYGSFLQDLEEIRENLQGFSMRFPPQVREGAASLTNSLTESLGDLIGAIGKPTVEAAGTVAKNIPNALIHIIFAILSAYFFIAERDRIVQTLQEKIPVWIREKWRFITEKFKRAIGGYFKAQFKIMGVVALILFVGFLILKIHYAVLLAILIAFLDFLPFFGTGTALIPWGIYKFLVGDYRTLVALAILYGVTQLVRQLIQPKLVGDSMGLNPLYTLFLLYLGYRLGSVLGMIFAVPLGLIVINLYKAGAFDYILDDVKILTEGILSLRNRD